MNRSAGEGTFPLPGADLHTFKEKALSWASRFSVFVFLDSNSYPDRYGAYDLIVATGKTSDFSRGNTGLTLAEVAAAHEERSRWIFGAMPYEAGASLFHLPSEDADAAFWEPGIVITVARDAKSFRIIGSSDAVALAAEIADAAVPGPGTAVPAVTFRSVTPESAYLEDVESIREKIAAGDFYEMNYCLRFTAGNVPTADPVALFRKLNNRNPAPFAALHRNGDSWTICASPERFLCRHGGRIYSQPIKGTARRGQTPEEDNALRHALEHDPKERAENIMITDLVRSDLAYACETGSIRVEELCAIYAYPAVHQMISTISGVPDADQPLTSAIRHAFPMGSMTGAPKKEVMKNIAAMESGPRGAYSGSIGYISPEGNYDFNVVIRSLFFHAGTGQLDYWAGGAITWDSQPRQEWEEIRLKAAAMERLFERP